MNHHIIASNSKFVAIALVGTTSHLTDFVRVDEGIFFCPRAPFQVDSKWREWIGTLRASEFEKANLVLLASMPSGVPQVLDHENQELERTVLKLWYSVLILGVPSYRGMNVASGCRVGEETQIRQLSRLPTFYYNAKSLPLALDSKSANEAGRIFGVLKRVYEQSDLFRQLRRGLKSFQRATSEEQDYDRLHGFVRSLDAIVMTEKGRGRKQFVDRCRSFARVDSTLDETLGLMYDLRSRVEHQADWDDLFPGANQEDRLRHANLVTRQAEALARTALHVILQDQSLINLFQKTEAIMAMWASKDFSYLSVHEENRVDLAAIPLFPISDWRSESGTGK